MNNWGKRLLGVALAGILVLGCVPAAAFAAEADGLCAHHTQHTADCGYSAAVEGHACGHEHTEECYQTVTECVHTHDDSCGYVPAVEGHGCDCQPDDSGKIVHTEGCGYVEPKEEVPCGHSCSVETGCVKQVLNCQHQHDAECGYVEPKEEVPCTFACAECAQEAAQKEAADQAAAVAAQLQALPTVQELQAMSQEDQTAAYKQVQSAYDAYDALTDGQKALVGDVEGTFAPLFTYFNSLAAPAAEDSNGTCGDNLTWVLTDDGTLTISGNGEMNDYTAGYAPWDVWNGRIKSVVINAGVTSIGNYAFTTSGLKEITFTGDAPTFGENPFYSVTATAYYPADNSTWTSDDVMQDYGGTITWTPYKGGTCGDNLTWVLSSDGTLTISGNGKMKDYMDTAAQSRAPWLVYKDSIKSIVINEGVTSIGKGAFYDVNLTSSVTISEGVTSIGERAFASNYQLAAITLPNSLKSLGDNVFSMCSNLTSITIPADVTSIGSRAFSSSGLSEITFTGDAPTFGDIPFSWCTVTAYYPANNSTWTSDVMQDYGGTVTWKKVCSEHVWGEWSTTSEPTCTEKGEQTRICSICEEKETSELNALGHSYGDPTWTWNDDHSAAATFTCARDESHVQTVTAEVTDEVTTAATCVTEGERTYTATVTFDNKTHTDTSKETIPALDHDWQITKMLRRPSCTRDGKAIYTCTRCSETKKDVVEAPGHDWDEGRVIKTATCTRRGETVYTCRSCGKTRTEYQDAYGHAWDDGVVVKEPACTKNGTVIYTCGTCGKTASERIPALGHNYENGVCTNCGGKEPSKPSWRPDWWPSWWE